MPQCYTLKLFVKYLSSFAVSSIIFFSTTDSIESN